MTVVAPSPTTVSLTVAKVTPTMSTSVAPTKVMVKKTKAKVTVVVVVECRDPDRHSDRSISRAKVLATGNLSDGRATLTLPVFTTTGTS